MYDPRVGRLGRGRLLRRVGRRGSRSALLTDEDLQATLGDKLMGQVNLVRLGVEST